MNCLCKCVHGSQGLNPHPASPKSDRVIFLYAKILVSDLGEVPPKEGGGGYPPNALLGNPCNNPSRSAPDAFFRLPRAPSPAA